MAPPHGLQSRDVAILFNPLAIVSAPDSTHVIVVPVFLPFLRFRAASSIYAAIIRI